MSTTSSPRSYKEPGSGWAFGVATFAGVMLVTVAVFQILEGIAAIAKDDIFVTGVKYAYQFDVTTWGWVHLILGIIGVATGLGLLAGQTWARIVGIIARRGRGPRELRVPAVLPALVAAHHRASTSW